MAVLDKFDRLLDANGDAKTDDDGGDMYEKVSPSPYRRVDCVHVEQRRLLGSELYDSGWPPSPQHFLRTVRRLTGILKIHLRTIFGYRKVSITNLPGEQRSVIHRDLRIIRRISRERLQDRAQDSIIEGNPALTNGDSHEEPEHPLFQTHCLCGRSCHERIGFGRPRISLRAAVSPEHLSDRFRQDNRCASVAQLEYPA